MDDIGRKLSREELHQLVWSTPVRKLADQFGLSDRGFAKICERHLVPVPGRGYWARLEAGQPVKKTPLRSVENTDLHTVYINTSARTPTPFIASVIEEARKQATERHVEAVPHPSSSQTDVPGPKPAVTEPTELSAPARSNGTIKKAQKQLTNSKADEWGMISTAGIRIHVSTMDRVISFLTILVAHLDRQKISVLVSDDSIQLSRGEDVLRVELMEARRREKHVPTPGELERKSKAQKAARGGWLFSLESFWPEYDYLYLGTLSVEIQNWAEGARKKWSDGKNQKLEGLVDAIVEGVQFHFDYNKAYREKSAEKERNRRHMAKRRELAGLRAKREDERLEFLQEIAEARREVDNLRKTISTVPSKEHLPPDYQRMLAWAQTRLEELEFNTSIENLQEALEERKLFSEPDELYDPEGEPAPKQNYWDD
ncbi:MULTISPECIES: hypothetical protein [unclassified Rhizobium]|uniref:hypothetical protein n=1 Tax=unclassified Rhizobium TaxID=2613769 RepID=UPI00115E5162|nr:MULTISPECIES: hypothetical protein [unclassified Rhizobium]TQX88464.1 hypothetical protein EQW76_11560 [Rhizobium sp. rho-13.1]TQY12660.1 hypothetical protein EQW74_15205 [Rhizobium sp. rho-1.1]